MKSSKLFSALSVALVASLMFAAAQSFSASPTSITFTKSVSSSIFTLTNTNATDPITVTLIPPTITAETSSVSFAITPNSAIIPNSSSTQFAISPGFVDYSKLLLGRVYSGNLLISSSKGDNQTITINVQKSYCNNGEVGGNLSISDVNINNLDGDDDTWMPLDEIEVDVEVENLNSDSSDRIKPDVKIALIDSKGKDVLKLDKVTLSRLDGGDSKSTTFSFKVPVGLGVDSGNYKLFIKAYENGGESDICTSEFGSDFYQPVSIERETDSDNFILIDNLQFDSNTSDCGSEAVLTGTVYNIGDEDQDGVKINLYNAELGVNQFIVLSNLDQDSSGKDIEFRFNIPKNLTEKIYKLQLRALYTYDSDKPENQDSSYDDQSGVFYTDLNVQGNCPASPIVQPSTNDAAITATLITDAVAGKDITIKATITNLASSTKTFTVLTSGIENFGTVQSVEPSSLTLAAGESQDVLITLKANSDSAGEHSFNIKTVYDGKLKEQPVSFTIEAQSGVVGLFNNLGQNWIIWAIVIVNVILLVLIIIVAVRLSKG